MQTFSRRMFLSATALAALLPRWGFAADSSESSRFKPGDSFNESETFADARTASPTRRLTTRRRFNQQPTYHLNACFSADSRFMVLATKFDDGSSALLRAEVETGQLAVLAVRPRGGRPFDGNGTAIIQATNWVVSNCAGLHLVNLATFEHRMLIESAGEGRRFGHPSGSLDGKYIFIPRYSPAVTVGGHTVNPVTHLEVEVATGKIREIFQETGAQCNHVVPCPADPDLLLIDRDWPPKFGHGGDGKTTRVWTLNIRTQALTEIRPRDPNRFQIHSNWNHRGDRIYYHGISAAHGAKKGGPHYIGVADRSGEVVWEHQFPTFHYGHVSSHTRKNQIITDGLVAPNLITAIDWEYAGPAGEPPMKVLAQHDSDWKAGQVSHPHCHVSPDGNWLSYNRGHAGRSDVYVVRIG